MTKETYEKMTGLLRSDEKLTKLLGVLNKVLTYIIFAAYPAMLVYLFIAKRELLLRAVIVPAASFAILSIFRRAVNFPRPYEVFDMPPVIPKNTKGKSFPSRHVFSVAIIGMVALYAFEAPIIGMIILIIAVLMSFLRVFSGVHFPRDVIAGFICGVLMGAALFIMRNS
ncbi:MAG: phosphatase PAP2 family protein [Oscillospiraceae bacterium]